MRQDDRILTLFVGRASRWQSHSETGPRAEEFVPEVTVTNDERFQVQIGSNVVTETNHNLWFDVVHAHVAVTEISVADGLFPATLVVACPYPGHCRGWKGRQTSNILDSRC